MIKQKFNDNKKTIDIIGNKKFSGWFLSLKATNLIASGKARFDERHPTFHK